MFINSECGEVSLFWCWSVSGGQLASKGKQGVLRPEHGRMQGHSVYAGEEAQTFVCPRIGRKMISLLTTSFLCWKF